MIGDRGVLAAVAWKTRIARFSIPAIRDALDALVSGAVVAQQHGQLELTFEKNTPSQVTLYVVIPGAPRKAVVTIDTLPPDRTDGTYDPRTADPIPSCWLDDTDATVELYNCHITSILSVPV